MTKGLLLGASSTRRILSDQFDRGFPHLRRTGAAPTAVRVDAARARIRSNLSGRRWKCGDPEPKLALVSQMLVLRFDWCWHKMLASCPGLRCAEGTVGE